MRNCVVVIKEQEMSGWGLGGGLVLREEKDSFPETSTLAHAVISKMVVSDKHREDSSLNARVHCVNLICMRQTAVLGVSGMAKTFEALSLRHKLSKT